MKRICNFLAVWAGIVVSTGAFAWSGYEVSENGISLVVDAIPDVTVPSEPVTVTVRLRNSREDKIEGMVRLDNFVDTWQVSGEATREMTVAPAVETVASFEIVSGKPVYSALYPVHAYAEFRHGEETTRLHAVRIFTVKPQPGENVDASLAEWTPSVLLPDSILSLIGITSHRVAWRYYEGDMVTEPIGWTGSDAVSRCHMSIQSVHRGETRRSINMHPPWQPEGGTVFCDYRVTLPKEGPIRLFFANAVRDSTASEPLGDGVLFRVRVLVADSLPAADDEGKVLFESFTDTKVWAEGEVDLSEFAGRTILLRLESHPGPNKDTTCDSSYWADPVLASGAALSQPRETALTSLPAEDMQIAREIAEGGTIPDEVIGFTLAGRSPCAVVVRPGACGLLDACFTFAGAAGTVGFRGIQVDLENAPVARWPSPYVIDRVNVSSRFGRMRFRHTIRRGTDTGHIDISLWQERAGLRIRVESDQRITRIAPGNWSRSAERVYYGHGYVIRNPKPFRAGFGGHNLATSHVGFEFADSPALLQAVDTPPNYLDVDPEKHAYALVTHMDSTLTFVPGAGAMQCAMDYEPLYDKQPADGVRNLAGRFCFDIWGGKYAEIAEHMAAMIRYGLTDSFITVHNWQRWGYDYRLPDVYPPNPAWGTVEDLHGLGRICRENGIPWGLHDNYIDFYPDAEDFTYSHIYFTASGQPHKAWYNKGRDAQSYKWRPDRILPFVKRNFRLVKKELQPTHCFLDVFTSSGCMDYWDDKGTFHSSLETRRYWGETFAWIRNYLGDDAPTTSEAGHDQLIGYLDGADCQWLRLVPKGQKHALQLVCDEWERVPWYDAVNHRRFILHGVGYSTRYQGGLSRELHGINSDDYISAEILSGHALMVDAGCWGREAVRKYWLAQDIARSLAGAAMTDFEFVDGDIHRQHVSWDNGAEIFVNRGSDEWVVKEYRLPQFGYLAVPSPGHRSVIERIGDAYAESSIGAEGWYCNARTVSAELQKRVHTLPAVEDFHWNGDSTFTYTIVWRTLAPARTGPHRIFVHFCNDKDMNGRSISFQDDHDPPVPTTAWPAELRMTRTVELPDSAAGTYRILIGLYNGRGRAMIDGVPAGEDRALIGTLDIRREEGRVTSVAFTDPGPAEAIPPAPVNEPGTMVDFGFAVTDGAFRLQEQGEDLEVIPLPDSPSFTVLLRPGELPVGSRRVENVTRQQGDGPPRSVPFCQDDRTLSFEHDGHSFAYRIHFRN